MRISCILLTYNQEVYAKEALDSLLSQTRRPDEIIIADDGSQDNTPAILRETVNGDPMRGRCQLLLAERNRGINVNLQDAVNASTGDVLVLLAGDDILTPSHLQLVEDTFRENPAVSYIVTGGIIIDEAGTATGTIDHRPKLHRNIRAAIRHGLPPVQPLGSAMRRELFQKFGPLPPEIPHEDVQLLFWGMLSGGVLAVPKRSVKYRVHSQSASAWLRNPSDDEDFFKRFMADLDGWRNNMAYWARSLRRSSQCDKLDLEARALKKVAYYEWLKDIPHHSMMARARAVMSFWRILCAREWVYTALGKRGFILWRRLRKALRRL